MKKRLLTIAALAFGFSSLAQITSFPYTEDFESGPGGWTPTGGIWQQGTPTTTNMVAANEQCINNVFATNLTGSYNNSALEIVTSPVFDCSSMTSDPVIKFDMFRLNEQCCDEIWVEYSLDGGATWPKVTAGVQNWYNDLGNQWWDNNTNNEYVNSVATLTGAAGVNDVRIRFVFTSDASVTYEGHAFDNVVVSEPTFADLEIVEIVSPTSGPNLSSSETITVVVRNNGPATVPFSDYSICINGDVLPQCNTTITNIPGYGTETLTLLGTLDLSNPGQLYNVNFFIGSAINDVNLCNDTMSMSIKHYIPINTFPYTEDFENGNGDWFTPNSLWEHGIPTTSSFTSANSNCVNNVIATDLDANYSNNAFEVIESPYFDFSGLFSDPIIKFDMFRRIESCCDEVWLESSIDGGATWQKVLGPGVNWYNDTGNQWWDNDATWVPTEANLTGLAGESSVRLRFVFTSDGSVTREGIGFDNMYIGPDFYVDLELVEVLSPAGGNLCTSFPYSESVQLVVTNVGNNEANPGNTGLCFGGDVATTCQQLVDTIPAGVTDTITLTNNLQFPSTGSFNIDFYLDHFGLSAKTCDDTLSLAYNVVELPQANIWDTNTCNPTFTVTLPPNPSHTFDWSNGSTDSFSTYNTTGTHWVDIYAPGCPTVTDSFEIIFNQPSTFTDVHVACETFTWIDGNTYTSSNNTATFNTVNSVGCDSLITLDLTITNPTTATDVQTACDSLVWIDGNTYTTSNNTATFVLTNAAGCDSTVTLDLTITNSNTGTDVQTACGPFTWIDGNTYTSDNNSATFTLQNAAGCDSIVTLDLTINSVNAATTTTDFTISADAAGATYQWIDCDNNNAPISGETGQSYTATANGNYAVIVTENGCTDTSACVAITTIGMPEFGMTHFALYPNPTSGNFSIDFSDVQEAVSIRVTTLSGQVVATSSASNTDHVDMTIDAATGVYLVELTDQNNQTAIVRVVKK
ncbi:MAG: T9SS type A sorting domain-containing protein [bacterium]|nr:T9SS type A sorting domain-containing protein [bacterium]